MFLSDFHGDAEAKYKMMVCYGRSDPAWENFILKSETD